MVCTAIKTTSRSDSIFPWTAWQAHPDPKGNLGSRVCKAYRVYKASRECRVHEASRECRVHEARKECRVREASRECRVREASRDYGVLKESKVYKANRVLRARKGQMDHPAPRVTLEFPRFVFVFHPSRNRSNPNTFHVYRHADEGHSA